MSGKTPQATQVPEKGEGGPGERGDLEAEFDEALSGPGEEPEPNRKLK